MTREDTVKSVNTYIHDYENLHWKTKANIVHRIHTIYDYFEKERTCKNCKQVKDCLILKINHNYNRVETFTCGDWESKNEK